MVRIFKKTIAIKTSLYYAKGDFNRLNIVIKDNVISIYSINTTTNA